MKNVGVVGDVSLEQYVKYSARKSDRCRQMNIDTSIRLATAQDFGLLPNQPKVTISDSCKAQLSKGNSRANRFNICKQNAR